MSNRLHLASGFKPRVSFCHNGAAEAGPKCRKTLWLKLQRSKCLRPKRRPGTHRHGKQYLLLLAKHCLSEWRPTCFLLALWWHCGAYGWMAVVPAGVLPDVLRSCLYQYSHYHRWHYPLPLLTNYMHTSVISSPSMIILLTTLNIYGSFLSYVFNVLFIVTKRPSHPDPLFLLPPLLFSMYFNWNVCFSLSTRPT